MCATYTVTIKLRHTLAHHPWIYHSRARINQRGGLREVYIHRHPYTQTRTRIRTHNTHLRLGHELGLLHVLAGSEAARPLLVHLGPRGNAVDGHVQHPPRAHDVRHDAVDVVEDAQDDVPLAEL